MSLYTPREEVENPGPSKIPVIACRSVVVQDYVGVDRTSARKKERVVRAWADALTLEEKRGFSGRT